MDRKEYEDDWSNLNIDWTQFEEPEDEETVDRLYTEEVAQQVVAENSSKPDPRVSYTPLVWEKFHQCPYNQSHLVNQEKLQTHLSKCKLQYELRHKPGNRPGNIQICKHNRSHHHPASEIEMHQELCANQGPTFDFQAHAPFQIFGNTGIESKAVPSSAATSAPEHSGHGLVRDTLEPAGVVMEPEASVNVPQFPTRGQVHGPAAQTSSEPPQSSVPSTSAHNFVEEDWDLEARMHPARPFAYNPIQAFMDNPHLLLPIPAGLPRNVRRALRTARNEARRAMDESNAERRAPGTVDRDVHQPGQFEVAQNVQVGRAYDFDPDAPEAPDFPY